jgi:hypothetical protein
MKKPAKTNGMIKKDAETPDSAVHPTVRWWPIHTPRLMGQPFENPVAKIPTAQSPIKPRQTGE